MLPTLQPGKSWLLIGSGGHALALLDAIRSAGMQPPIAVIDLEERNWGRMVSSHRVLGGEELLAGLRAQQCECCVIGVGDEGDIEPRRRAHCAATQVGLRPMIVRHSSSLISSSARLAAGVQLMAGSIVSAQCELNEHALIDTGAIMQPSVQVGADSHIAPGAKLLTGSRIGQRTHIGAGTTILAGVTVGDDCLVGPGLVIQRHMPSGSTAVGSGAQIIEQQGWRIAG